jgi:cyclase
MLKKRISAMVTIYKGIVVQSLGYKNYLPIGSPERVVENLDRWGADEIYIQVIDRSINNLGPDFSLLERIASLGITTPIIYGGGISSVLDAKKVIKNGADRISIDGIYWQDKEIALKISEKLGSQAVIINLPCEVIDNQIFHFNYLAKKLTKFKNKDYEFLSSGFCISEIMISDYKHEGFPQGFNSQLVDFFSTTNASLILFGGISNVDQISSLLNIPKVSSVCVGNFLNFKEHSIQNIKKMISNPLLRVAKYSKI